jgi:hypothetical protein
VHFSLPCDADYGVVPTKEEEDYADSAVPVRPKPHNNRPAGLHLSCPRADRGAVSYPLQRLRTRETVQPTELLLQATWAHHHAPSMQGFYAIHEGSMLRAKPKS